MESNGAVISTLSVLPHPLQMRSCQLKWARRRSVVANADPRATDSPALTIGFARGQPPSNFFGLEVDSELLVNIGRQFNLANEEHDCQQREFHGVHRAPSTNATVPIANFMTLGQPPWCRLSGGADPPGHGPGRPSLSDHQKLNPFAAEIHVQPFNVRQVVRK